MAGMLGPEPRRWRTALLSFLSMVVFALVMPRVGSDFWQASVLGAPILITLTFAYQAGRRQQALGRDALRIATAAVVSILGMVALAMLFVAISLLIGPAPQDSLFKIVLDRFSPNLRSDSAFPFVLLFFVGIAIVLVVVYQRGRPAREAAEADLQHEAQIERAARAAATGQEPITR